jgi:hypothetical protein
VFKSRFKGARAVASAIFSKWQPLYFIIVSTQKIILRVINLSIADADNLCPFIAEIQAEVIIWNCTIFIAVLSTLARDTETDCAPIRRRCSYFVLALCLLVDMVSSFIWGNMSNHNKAVSVGGFLLFLDNQITSSIASQVVIAIHLLFVSCRSRSGRGWAYAALRFELDECGKGAMSKIILQKMKRNLSNHGATASVACASAPMLEYAGDAKGIQDEVAAGSSAFSRLRRRFERFQQRQISRCRVFVIPCIANSDVGGDDVDGRAGFRIARPAFDFRCLQPLQRLADAHPKLYAGFIFYALVVPAIVLLFTLPEKDKGKPISVFNSCIFVCILGILASKRQGLDRIAFKHVASSFRFLTCVVLLAGWIALSIRDILISNYEKSRAVAVGTMCLLFLQSSLFECSPNMPTYFQICITVTLLPRMRMRVF